MKLFARMMRVVAVGLALSAFVVAPAAASPSDPETVPFGWPVVADMETTPAVEPLQAPLTNRGALIKLSPIGSGSPGVQTIVAPRGYAIANPSNNFLFNPVSVVQRGDQLYDVADASGSIIEIDLVTGKQSLLWSGAPLTTPQAIVVDPLTDDLLVLDSGAGTGGSGGIFRLHEGVSGAIDTPVLVHDGGYGPSNASTWHMVTPRGMDIDAQGNLYVIDMQASPATSSYLNGTLFKLNPNAPDDVNDPATTPRQPFAWDAIGTPINIPEGSPVPPTGEFFLDPRGVTVRPDGIYVADSKDNVLESSGAIIRVDLTTGQQSLVAGGFFYNPFNFFTGAVYGVAPVDPTFGTTQQPGDPAPCTVATKPTCDDVYALDIDYGDNSSGPTGMVDTVDVTNTDPRFNQGRFAGGPFGSLAFPFSFNNTLNNATPSFVEPRALVTSRNMPDPPVISVNTPGAGNLGAAQIIEPADGSPPGQANCGAAGTDPCRIAFNIRLSNPWKRTVKVNYVVTDGTATSVDYTNPTLAGLPPAATPLTMTFAAGQTVQTVYVPVTADLLNEPDETVNIALSSPVNGTLDPVLTRRTAVGTIFDNDLPPTVSATSPAPFVEFNGNVPCHLHLDAPSGRTITVNWTSADGSAVAPGDYTANTTSVTFAPLQVDADIVLAAKDDLLDEDSENFFFNLTGASFATIPAGTKCTADVLDNDEPPQLTIKDVKSNEGNSGQRQVTLSVVMSSPSGKKASVAWATKDDAATLSNKDYVQASGILELAPGETSKSIVVKFVGDTAKEQDEPFKVVLSTPVNAGILQGTANATIVNDDADAVVTDPGGDVQDTPPTTGGKTKVCKSRRTFHIRVKKTKLRQAKVVSAKVFVNGKLVTTRRGKRLTAPVVLKGLKKGRYKVVIKAKLSDGRTVTDIRRYYTCRPKIKK